MLSLLENANRLPDSLEAEPGLAELFYYAQLD
ncbi:hypothetical protein LCGC14_0296020 [marine sediment metagenome]|uniref:Uncharacterized protein n=1 Tax=marine sediment metagenome TaxID=412755 RepID=A0A0F9U8Z6_9ZZZZ